MTIPCDSVANVTSQGAPRVGLRTSTWSGRHHLQLYRRTDLHTQRHIGPGTVHCDLHQAIRVFIPEGLAGID